MYWRYFIFFAMDTAPRAAPIALSSTALPFVVPKPEIPISRAICSSSVSSDSIGTEATLGFAATVADAAPLLLHTEEAAADAPSRGRECGERDRRRSRLRECERERRRSGLGERDRRL